jgi:catechol 2,3-dioxygenase-like lactoylglutathione lyase family enzyme
MDLGAFSISLAVRDLHASKDFYERLGFSAFHGDADQGWLMLKNGAVVIGLFQGMFERNILTFNPGWDQDARPVDPFTDIRDLRAQLTARGLTVEPGVDEASSGPASFVINDPDGNPILIDQHR